uniref:Uncharacterized protein n=1 Tax=Kuenenia stuttgartiensis TaxID=174633 RepID=Q1PV26_KUEST|nr:unknown protein [Candidatus Kuenenia stuttgartiensis]
MESCHGCFFLTPLTVTKNRECSRFSLKQCSQTGVWEQAGNALKVNAIKLSSRQQTSPLKKGDKGGCF